MEFATWLENQLSRYNLTVYQLSRRSGVHQSTIANWLNGAKPQQNKASAVKAAIKEIAQEQEELIDSLPWEKPYTDTAENDEKAPSVSDEAMRMARDYDKLDNWGRQAVRDLTDTELARMEDEARFMNGAMLEDEPKVINLYAEPAAAGIAVPTMGVDFEPYTLKPDDPQGAAFAVRLQGDSMEPYFPDGSIVFVNHDAMVNGDIGIFCVDSGTVCKQYYRDPLGMVYLFSLNRMRSDADVILGPSSNRTLICQGRVITKRRFPIPV